MRRFITTSLNGSEPGQRVALSRREAHHLSRVTRLAVGEVCELLDGEGRRARARVEALAPDAVVLRQEGRVEARPAAHARLTVAQAIPKRQVLDFIVEKAQELGVERLIPLESARTEARPDAARFGRMRARFERIAREAAKQSGNPRLVCVEEPAAFERLLARAGEFDRGWILTPGAELKLAEALERARAAAKEGGWKALLVIGPEGGFTQEEERAARAAGVEPARLTEHVLRADTAFVAAAGLVRALLP